MSADAWLPFAVSALCVIVIMPTLWSGWYGDDSFFSNLSGQLAADRTSLGNAMAQAFWIWFHGAGRFYPVAIVEKYLVFAVFTNVVAYKWLLVAATVASLELFRRCVAAYSNVQFANLAALLVVIFFQERGYHDSILAYNGMVQTVALAVFGSLLTFRRALLRNDAGTMAAAAGLFLIAALTYEDAYCLCLLFPLAAFATGKSFRDAFRLAIPFFAIAGGLVAFDVVLRSLAHLSTNDGYAMDFSVASVARTAAVQIIAAMPLSYWFIDPLVIFRLRPSFFLETPGSLPPALVFPLFGVTAWFAAERLRSSGRVLGWLLCGLLLLVIPALPIALMVKYQHELRLGLGYLPVFLESFGVALAIAALVSVVSAPQRRGVHAVFALAIA
ncbi:MAG: hypothetical protein ACREMT_02985, partial [Vulcanimicrobiaceae bacterium]